MWYQIETVYRSLPVPFQEAIVAWRGRQLHRQRFGPDYGPLAQFLLESERSTPERVREYQETRLRALVAHAYDTVPYYCDLMDGLRLRPGDIRTAEDLQKLPLLTKDDVRAAGDRMISSSFNKRFLRRAWTSATTTSPLAVYWDREVQLMNHAACMRLRRWAGVPFGRPYATMHGGPAVPVTQKGPPFWRHNPAWNQVFFSTLHVSDENLVHYVKKLRDFRAEALDTYPSCAYVIARFLESRGEYLPLKCVVLTGEPLLKTEKGIIEERFQCRTLDAYGAAERVVFSSECEERNGHHIYDEYGITEITDHEGNVLPNEERGLIVGTGLHNHAMPLIRYVTGDVAARVDRECPCGRPLSMLDGLTSRVGDILVTPDGRMVPGRMVTWAVKIMKGVTQWQVTQEQKDHITIRVVRESPVTDEEREGVLGYISRRLGPEVNVDIEIVDEIERTARGKLRHVVSTVPLVWGGFNRITSGDEGLE